MITVCQVTTTPDHFLDMVFNTGEKRRFDMKPYLGYPVFKRLQNPGFFALARIDYDTVTWPGDIDIAPETLYYQSTPVQND